MSFILPHHRQQSQYRPISTYRKYVVYMLKLLFFVVFTCCLYRHSTVSLIKPIPALELSVPLLPHRLWQHLQHPLLREYSVDEAGLGFFLLFQEVGDAVEHGLQDAFVFVASLQEEEDVHGQRV